MKHKLSEMIKAKADNMDLVIIVKNCQNDGAWWALKSDKEILPSFSNGEYFACLPQHEEACLHWLSGGKSQVEYTQASYPYWCDIDSDESNWSDGHVFMDKTLNIRIKPKKEKRWIGVNVTTGKTTSAYTHDDEGNYAEDEVRLTNGNLSEWQFIEIEVEV